MGKEYNEFINYSVEEFKKKTVGRYYVLSWVPVRSVHNPQRCQVKYRRWKPGDIYTRPIPIENVVVTKPMDAKIPVVRRREKEEIKMAVAGQDAYRKLWGITPEGGRAKGFGIHTLFGWGLIIVILYIMYKAIKR